MSDSTSETSRNASDRRNPADDPSPPLAAVELLSHGARHALEFDHSAPTAPLS